MKTLKIPKATIIRLSKYSRYLTEVARRGISNISSYDIASGVSVNSVQVRKDLAYFGNFGAKGIGYDVRDLSQHLIKILGLSKNWNVSLAGLGNLGLALCKYKGFRERGFIISSIFDIDPNKIGSEINGVEVFSMTQMEEVIQKENTHIGIICVPVSAAQEIANAMVRSGVKAILNFAPVSLKVPIGVFLRNVDLVVDLELLAFNLGESELINRLYADN